MSLIKTIIYATSNHKEPFSEWFIDLDKQAKSIILARLERIPLGDLGDCKSIGNGVSELRIHHGPGYRIYFGKRGNTLVILLIGGNKGTQSRDIAKATRYWLDYKETL